MPAKLADPSLDQLLKTRTDLWRGRARSATTVVPTGHERLDHWLPTGGWPGGQIIELIPARMASGELELLLPALAEQTRQGKPVVLAAPPLVPCPQALSAAGMDLSRLLVVRQDGQALWAAEQCLKSGLCGMIVAWLPSGRLQSRTIRRLQLAAEQGPAAVFVCYPPGRQPLSGLARLRLLVHPGPEVELARSAGLHRHGRLDLHPQRVVALHRPGPEGHERGRS